ncbi:hypothetical protein FJT64_019713 [Amphibalanus amphitrite]|uniref:RNase H type-1 domain-containing protein n=1 Tax=Amphibalanus amphitrite TaxID=1232801 RepID=A0A6A4X452_AMPAM|nr:hypothetical protein FJT64_019713 [Amphibalanus amphitrite]
MWCFRAFRAQGGLQDQDGAARDEPRAGGNGNSNDGNTARRAFRSPAEFAACTGVDQELIDRDGTVLQAVSCLHRLDIDALSAYCRRTAELYVERYSHHPMSTTLHKLLSHSAAVVESCHLPIGMMSEEAAEATHKRVRQYRLRHTRKDSRIHTMSDLLGYLLVASDPLLSSLALIKRVLLCTDSRSGLQLLSRGPDDQQSAIGQRVWGLIDALTAAGKDITLHWVPGHADLAGNEAADRLANQAAADCAQEEAPIDLSSARTAIRRWTSELASARAQRHPHREPTPSHDELDRWGQATLSQLRTGYCPLVRATAHRLGLVEDPTCRACGEEEEDVEHLLAGCPAHVGRAAAVQLTSVRFGS